MGIVQDQEVLNVHAAGEFGYARLAISIAIYKAGEAMTQRAERFASQC